jgi:mono/diheme cytochrome c family protein
MERELRVDLQGRSAEVAEVLRSQFGAPDNPRWPEALTKSNEYLSLTDRESLTRAAGPVGRNFDLVEVGLFRKQCAQCHGISGDGIGPTAALLDPYPRDFRRGTFKFKNSAFGDRPSLDDLIETITKGVPGTSMPAMENLKHSKHYADDIPVLARYVRYLSIRGEVERELMMDTIRDLEEEETLFDGGLELSAPEVFSQKQARIDEVIRRVADRWVEPSSGNVGQAKESPFLAFKQRNPLWIDELLPDSAVMQDQLFQASLQRGRALFEGSVAACSQCHGVDGTGDPKWKDYDEWTKDWTIRAGINPLAKSEWKPLKKLGLLKPVPVSPRNLALQAYRGVSANGDAGVSEPLVKDLGKKTSRLAILRAVLNGIEGSPMPAAALESSTKGGMTDEQIMDLVRYVESISTPTATSRLVAGGVGE